MKPSLLCERIPDAAERAPDGTLTAWEIEKSSKGRRRREAILTAYALSAYRRVIWIAPEAQLAALIRAHIGELGLEEQMQVIREIPADRR